MKKIKLKAWHIKQKRFININGVDINFKGCSNEGEIYLVYEQGVLESYSIEDIELMQFTGLKDKNGKEIYGGDRIQIKHPFKSREFTGEVIWMNYKFGCKDFLFTHFDDPSEIFSEGTEYIEVVGNIHQNKDILS